MNATASGLPSQQGGLRNEHDSAHALCLCSIVDLHNHEGTNPDYELTGMTAENALPRLLPERFAVLLCWGDIEMSRHGDDNLLFGHSLHL